MEDNRIQHTVLHCYIIGNKSRGRQRKTLMDNVKGDLCMHNMDIRDVIDMTRDLCKQHYSKCPDFYLFTFWQNRFKLVWGHPRGMGGRHE